MTSALARTWDSHQADNRLSLSHPVSAAPFCRCYLHRLRNCYRCVNQTVVIHRVISSFCDEILVWMLKSLTFCFQTHFCCPSAKSLRMLCTAWLAVMWYTALLEMLVFPIRCQRLKQCHHNLRLLEERRRCPSARVMLPTFIFLCCFCILGHGGPPLGTRRIWPVRLLESGLSSITHWCDPLVRASTESQIWRNLSNEKMLLPSTLQSSWTLLSSTSSKFVFVCRSASMYFRGIGNDETLGTYG